MRYAFINESRKQIKVAMKKLSRQLEFDLYGFNRGYIKIRKGKGFHNMKYHLHDLAKGQLLIKFMA